MALEQPRMRPGQVRRWRRTGPVSSVFGVWRIPIVITPNQTPGIDGRWQSASWVGLDGAFLGPMTSQLPSSDVLQSGVAQNITLDLDAEYYAWFEWFVQVPVDTPPEDVDPVSGYPKTWVDPVSGICQYVLPIKIEGFPVRLSDEISCNVMYSSDHAFGIIYIANLTTCQHCPPIVLAPRLKGRVSTALRQNGSWKRRTAAWTEA